METLKAKKSDNPLRAFVNNNFLIKYKFKGQPQTYLIGGGRLHTLVGETQANKYFKKVAEGKKQVFKFSFQNTIEIKFISK